MGIVIGMDEAGYGPNLGPLVVTVTVWEVPDEPHKTTFWPEFADVLADAPCRDGTRLHIADSKQVHSSSQGVGALEVGVLSALALWQQLPDSWLALWRTVGLHPPEMPECEPWFAGCDLPLPHQACLERVRGFAERWSALCSHHGIRLCEIKSDIVLTQRFNELTAEYNSKGVALSRISLHLLSQVWEAGGQVPTLVIADKHGGRNRYDELLADVSQGEFIFRREEGLQRSSYRVGRTDVHFQTRAEAHFPVALASMVSKYLREVAMILFNRFWQAHLPELRETKGYPGDARRFKDEIAAVQSRLRIHDRVVWRDR